MTYENKVKALNLVRCLFALVLLISALGRIGGTHVVTSGFIATDFRMPADYLSLVFGIFEVSMAAFIAIGVRSQIGYWVYSVYLISMSIYFHAFWMVDPQVQFEKQILFFKTLLTALGVLGFGLFQSLLNEPEE